MTFEVHHKHLGRIAFHPGVQAYTQDPDNLRDYTRQMRRWCLGFWQTVRRHGFWPSRFCLALAVTVFELLMSSLFFVSLPLVMLALGVDGLIGDAVPAVSETGGVPGRRLRPAAAVPRRRPARLQPDRARRDHPEATPVPHARSRLPRHAGGRRRRGALHPAAGVGPDVLGEVGEPDAPGLTPPSLKPASGRPSRRPGSARAPPGWRRGGSRHRRRGRTDAARRRRTAAGDPVAAGASHSAGISVATCSSSAVVAF